MPFPRLWTHARLSWELCLHEPDLLFVPSHVLPLLHPKKSVVTVHDLGFRHYPQTHRTLDRFYLELSTWYHSRVAAHLIVDSNHTRQDLIEAYGVPSQRISVVYPGRDETLARIRDSTDLAVVKRQYGIRGDYILHIGTLHPRKNLLRLIDAFALVRRRLGSRFLALRLVLAGKAGWSCGTLLDRVADLGLEDHVQFPGYVPRIHLAALLSGALCLAFPSLYEGFGLPVVEAMACGTAVVCSETSSLPEAAGEAALLVDPEDTCAWVEALCQMLTDPSLRHRLIDQGYRQSQKFSWSRAASEVLGVFSEVASG